MSNAETSNRIVKALAMARVMQAQGVSWQDASKVTINQGPFWSAVVTATGRAPKLSQKTRAMALYFLAAMQGRKLRRVK